MASAYSTPRDFGKYIKPVNTELVNFVLQSKQQKFDYNIAKVEQTLAEFGDLGLVRDQDKQYLVDKVQSITSQMGNIEEMDWSDGGTTRQIQSGIKGAIDERVRNDVAMSRKYTKFMSEVEDIKKNDFEKYSDANVAYAAKEAGLEGWLSGEKGSFGNLEYTPFIDVSAQQREILEKTITMKHGITKEVLDPNDNSRYIKSTHYGLTEKDVRDKVLQNLTPQERKQLEINAWSTYGDQAPAVYDAYVKPQIEKYEADRKKLTLNLEGKTPAEKAIIKEEVAQVDRALNNLKARKDSPEALYRFLGQEELVGGLAQIYAPVETSRTFSDNTAYFKRLEKAKEQAQAALGNTDLNNNGENDVTSVSLLTDPEDDYSFADAAEKEIENHRTELKGTFNQAFNRLSAEEKDDFNLGYEQHLNESGLEDNIANKTAFMIEQSSGGKGKYFRPDELVAAKKADRNYRKRLEIQTENFDEAMEEQLAVNAEKIFQGVKENRSIEMIDESGNVVSMSDYLEGYDSIGDLPENKKKQLLKSVYADMTLSQTKTFDREEGTHGLNSYNITRLAKVNGETGVDLPMLVNPDNIAFGSYSKGKSFEKLKKDMQLPAKMTKEQFDEHILPLVEQRGQAADSGVFDFGLGNVLERTAINLRKEFLGGAVKGNIIIGGEGTQTRRDLEVAMEKGLYDTFSIMDNSVEDDATIRNALNDRDSFRANYEAKMKEDAPNFAQNKAIIVEPSGTREGESVPAFENLINASKGMLNPKGGRIIVTEDETGDYYNVEQINSRWVTTGDGTEEKTERRVAKIAKVDLQNGSFMQWVDTKDQVDRITASNTKSLPSDNITFADGKSHRDYLAGVAQMFGINNEAGLANFTAQGAKTNMLAAHPEIFQDPEHGARFKQLAKSMIDNSHLMRINMIPDVTGSFNMAIQYKEEEDGQAVWKNLQVIPTETSDITETASMIDVAPQIFYYDYMNRLFTDIKNSEVGAEAVEDDLKILSKIFLK